MEDLLTKLADILDMSVDGLLTSYPTLRNQYTSIYTIDRLSKLTDGLTLITGVLAILALLAGVTLWVEEDETVGFKVSLRMWVAFIVIMLINIALNSAAVKLAPDLMFIKSLM